MSSLIVQVRKLKGLISYLGPDYKGFQIQKSEDTVQAQLEQVLSKICDHRVKITGAGRTDSGVHAYQQVFNFETKSSINCNNLKRALNSSLPESIRIINISEAEDTFHARFDAKKRIYIYNFSTAGDIPIYLKDYVWELFPAELNMKKIRKAIRFIEGKHDFTYFCAKSDENKSKVREIYKVSLKKYHPSVWPGSSKKIKGDVWVLQIEGNAFLQRMVRMIVGFLVEIGRGKRTISGLKNALKGNYSENVAKRTAPARGLCLVNVEY